MSKTEILILGAGPAGLGAAYKLSQRKGISVTVVEKNASVGGNAGSFNIRGIPVDYGSHRLHPSTDPEILGDIRKLLGPDLLDRPRHGRIRLRGRWIHFPLKPIDLACKLPPSFMLGVVKDSLGKLLPAARDGRESFVSILEKGLGRTICHDFYFPYSRKIWGLPVENLSPVQARRRVSAGSLSKMARKILSSVPGFKPPGSGRFFYPKRGFGQISERLFEAASRQGARFHFGAQVEQVETENNRVSSVVIRNGDRLETLRPDHLWSTIPLTRLAQSVSGVPADVLEAGNRISYRAMMLIYLVLETPQFTEFDAHYFPEEAVQITRLSEQKNYHASTEPENVTTICAELPCFTSDACWKMTDAELAELVKESLANAGIPVKVPVIECVAKRLTHAYPIYVDGYEENFGKIDDHLARYENLLTFGRQGLFAHDNTHHALFMAYSANNCLDEQGRFDTNKWRAFRKIFESHVVED